jgi:hypothetical protein
MYQLDEQYLAQYGGQQTVCGCCQQPWTLPTSAAGHAGAASMNASVPSASSVIPLATAVGPPAGGHSAGPVLAYALPQGYRGPVLREDGVFTAPDGAQFPPICVKCGRPSDGIPLRKTLYWHPGWVYITILAAVWVYILLALVTRKKGTITLGLCAKHRIARRNYIYFGFGVSVLGVGLIVYYLMSPFDAFRGAIAFGILSIVVGLIIAALTARTLSPTKIDGGYLWLTGAGKPFRDAFRAHMQATQPFYPH